MNELENLLTLVTDGKPSKKQIDKEIDQFVSELIAKCYSRSFTEVSRAVFDEKWTLYEKGNFSILVHPKYHIEVFEYVNKSLIKYHPFIKIDPNYTYRVFDHNLWVQVPLILEITSKMKELMILEKNLNKNLPKKKYSNKTISKI